MTAGVTAASPGQEVLQAPALLTPHCRPRHGWDGAGTRSHQWQLMLALRERATGAGGSCCLFGFIPLRLRGPCAGHWASTRRGQENPSERFIRAARNQDQCYHTAGLGDFTWLDTLARISHNPRLFIIYNKKFSSFCTINARKICCLLQS